MYINMAYISMKMLLFITMTKVFLKISQGLSDANPNTNPKVEKSLQTFQNCGSFAWDCGTSSQYPQQQPLVPNCLLQNGDHCCCNWGFSPSGNLCGCSSSVATSALTFFPTFSPTPFKPSVKPSKPPSFSPTKKQPSTQPSTSPSSFPTKLSPTSKPNYSPSSSPSQKLTSFPTPKPTSFPPSAKSTNIPSVAPIRSLLPTSAQVTTANPSSGTVITVTACGTNAFICPNGSPSPQQPAIPGVVVASGGQCCCYWGYTPSINAGCTNQPLASPTAEPTTSYHPTVTPAPTRTAVPTISIAPSNTASPTPTSYVGWYDWTWISQKVPPAGLNLAVAFSGWADVASALSESSAIYSQLKGKKFLSIGGGNGNGYLTAATLSALDAAVSGGKLSGYDGVCYDVENGDSGLASNFAASFANSKANKFLVLVTVSHSKPYGVGDGVDLMNSFFPNSNIDILSPQLYSGGTEPANDYTYVGVPWSSYATAKAAVVPSIVTASYYSDAQNYFATPSRSGTSFNIKGFIQWAQQ